MVASASQALPTSRFVVARKKSLSGYLLYHIQQQSISAMKIPTRISKIRAAISLGLLLSSSSLGYAAPPDLTAAGVIDAVRAVPNDISTPYDETFNLGATGLRGWISIERKAELVGYEGTFTAASRQILVTVASEPGNATIAVNDVILGAMRGSTGTVPYFSKDSRKEFGEALTDAERFRPTGITTDFGLRVKRWRGPAPGTVTDVNIAIEELGTYSATSPFLCPKTDNIIAKSRAKLVSQMRVDPLQFFTGDTESTKIGGAVNGLALLAISKPGDPDYAEVQLRLKEYAQSLAAKENEYYGKYTWFCSYRSIFLSEYYLRSVANGLPDNSVLAGIARNTKELSNRQSMYGTYGHGGSSPKADGSPNGSVPPYGPVNAAGLPANIAIVLGKKALVAGSAVVGPEIDPAIQRGSNFFSYYVNKGSIPYGEHDPWVMSHSSNGKDPMCAVLFGLQADRPAATEYFTRMSIAGYNGREYGHDNQEFSYFWGVLAANMGGPAAATKFMEKCRWHFDLTRRTDGSFTYQGREQYGGGRTEDGTYLGESWHYNINPTACHLISYALSLQRLSITGRGAIPANTLSPAKVTNAIAAATFKQDCTAFTIPQLITALNEYDPIVRNEAASELAGRSLDATHLASLMSMLTDMTNANGRAGACQTFGIRKSLDALPLINARLSDPDVWVRAKATLAIMNYDTANTGQYCDSMLTAFAANATDPEVIVWDDPVQISNRFLSIALFGNATGDGFKGNNIVLYTKNAPKNLLYPAVRVGLKQPDSYPRFGAAQFVEDHLSLADVQELTLDLFEVITSRCQADLMWYYQPKKCGIRTLVKHRCAEAIPLALAMLKVERGWDWASNGFMPTYMDTLKYYGDLARWTLPALEGDITTSLNLLHPDDYAKLKPQLVNTIATVKGAITSPSGVINLLPMATSQVVVTTGSKAITLTGTSPRSAVTFSNVTAPAHGTVSGTPPNLIYTPTAGYSGPDHFLFKVKDSLTTSESGTVSIIVGTAGTGLKGEYYDNSDFTNLKLTRADAQVNFDWATGSPAASIGTDTFSVRWTGQLLVPETGNYTFSTLSSDGVRLYINGDPVIDDLTDHTTSWTDSTSVSLTAGQRVELQMDYYEYTGSATAKLKWTGPSFAGRNGMIIAKNWLYEGAGLVASVAYAYPQKLTMLRNSDQVITLTGGGGSVSPLTYSILTPPSHGTLTGTVPNLTYRPANNYNGTDNFTFTVNNGNGNSAPATVFIDILVGQPAAYFWTQAVPGNWSGSFWTNTAGNAVTPAATGSAAYFLNFNQAGSYTTTHNLSDNFEFNQLNFASAVTIGGSKSLSPSSNGSFGPQINQNSASVVTIDAPFNLVTMTTLSGTGFGQVNLTSAVTGPGGLTMNSPGTLNIFGFPTKQSNTYSGGTVVNNGTLHLGAINPNGTSSVCVNPAGSGPVTLNNRGTIGFESVRASNSLIANGGTLSAQNGWGALWSGPISLNANLTCRSSNQLELSGNISGLGGLTKMDEGTLYLSGTNSFTGANFVKKGNLKCTAMALGRGLLDITSGAKVNLDFTGTRVIAGLTYNGASALPAGTYGSNASPAANKNDGYFSGTGTVTILPNNEDLPVSSGLVLRMDASQIAGTVDGAQLDIWKDTSGALNNATRQGGSTVGYPKYIASGVNGRPVVRFDSPIGDTGDYMKFNRISTIRSVFWVLKENPGLADYHFLLGDSVTYDFHRGSTPNGPLWNTGYVSENISGGATKLMGSLINGTTTSLPSGNFQLVSLVTTGNVSANQICQDRTYHGSWQGDIAEILIYDRALTSTEETLVGTYLATKYGLVTSYPLSAIPATPAAVTAAPEATTSGAVRVSWASVPGATSYNVWSRNTQSSVVQVVSSSTPSCVMGGLTVGTAYEFKVSAVYANSTAGNYSSAVTAVPVTATSAYAAWAGGTSQGLTAGMNNGPMDDPDRDGISNMLEFALGGRPMVNSRTILPILSKIGGSWFLEYSRSDLSQFSSNQVVEYSSDLKVWTQIPIPMVTNSAVIVTASSPSDTVTVAIPAVVGKPTFARLKVTQ